MRRLISPAILVMLAIAGCSNPETVRQPGDLPITDAATFETLLDASQTPVVVNLWASWCVPCRSEAPLLTEAHRRLGDQIRFIGVSTEDRQGDAGEFVTEFSMDFENYFDEQGEVKAMVGSLGLPTTFFVAPGGEVVSTVFGIIDERRLALEIDELLAR